MDYALNYHSVLLAMFCAGLILFIQLMVANLAGFSSKKSPGHPVPADHDDFLFRAIRGYKNMNESIAAFILFSVVGIFSTADPVWLAKLSWMYVITRGVYAVCYWFNLKLSRSISFGISLFALLAMAMVVGMSFL